VNADDDRVLACMLILVNYLNTDIATRGGPDRDRAEAVMSAVRGLLGDGVVDMLLGTPA
jgi:hypothetical protein